jgi:predicted secreted protein
MEKSLFVLLIVFVLVSSGCEKEGPKADYEISVNELLDVTFESNPSTGYSWIWANKEKVLVVDSADYVFYPRYPNMMGSPGIETWTLKGISKGMDTLKFHYSCSWISNSIIAKQEFTVKVK